MSLSDILEQVRSQLPDPALVGPPFQVPPAAPCYIVAVPQVSEVLGTGAACQITRASVDIVCVPPTGSDTHALVAMADQVVALFGASVTSGQAEPNPFTDVDDVWTYRLTVEV